MLIMLMSYDFVTLLLLILDNMFDIFYNNSSRFYMEVAIMSKKWFRFCGAAIVITALALIGWSIAIGNAVIPIPVALAGVGLLYLCRRLVKGVVEDERAYRISEKASRFALQVFAFAAAIVGTTLIALSTDDSSAFREVGFTLAFSACALLMLYLVSYAYHNKKS